MRLGQYESKTISWYALPSPQEQTASSLVGIDSDICWATLLYQPQGSGARPRQGQEEDKTRTQSRATDRGAAKTRARGGQDPDTEPGHRQGRGEDKGKRRIRPGHRAGPHSPATEFKGAAKTRRRGGQGPATEPGHRARPQSSRARAVSVASSFFSKIEPQQ